MKIKRNSLLFPKKVFKKFCSRNISVCGVKFLLRTPSLRSRQRTYKVVAILKGNLDKVVPVQAGLVTHSSQLTPVKLVRETVTNLQDGQLLVWLP